MNIRLVRYILFMNEYDRAYKIIHKQQPTFDELTDKLKLSKRKTRKIITRMKNSGIPIDYLDIGDKTVLCIDNSLFGIKEFDVPTDYFALISDTHIGADTACESELEAFYETLQEKGIKDVFHSGDIIDGVGVYRGQEFETKIHGITNQCNHVIKNYPKKKGIKTHFVTGNHDLRQFEKSGIEVGEMISKNRRDMDYFGRYTGRAVIDEYDQHHKKILTDCAEFRKIYSILKGN